jgi:hypothetical protein
MCSPLVECAKNGQAVADANRYRELISFRAMLENPKIYRHEALYLYQSYLTVNTETLNQVGRHLVAHLVSPFT